MYFSCFRPFAVAKNLDSPKSQFLKGIKILSAAAADGICEYKEWRRREGEGWHCAYAVYSTTSSIGRLCV